MKRDSTLCPWATATLFMLYNCPALSLTLSVRQSRLVQIPVHPSCQNEVAFFSSRPNIVALGTSQSSDGVFSSPRRRLRRRRSCMLDDSHFGHSIPLHTSRPPPLPPPKSSLWPTAMDKVLPLGRLVGVQLPQDLSLDDALNAAKAELLPEEMDYCSALHPSVQLPFIGGRIAIRRGLKLCSRSRTEMKGKGNTEPVAPVAAILHDCYGAPLLPKGLSASISHKRHLAVAIVQPGCAGNLGVDIEMPAVRRRADLRRKVLTQRECENLGNVTGLSVEEEVLLRFSMKEAVYKAAHPLLRRHLGFKDVEVQPRDGSECDVQTTIPGAWGNVRLSAGWLHLPNVLGQPLLLTYCKAVDCGRFAGGGDNDDDAATVSQDGSGRY